jgi:hypothetical protein
VTDTSPTVFDVHDPQRNPWLIAPPEFVEAYCAWLEAHGIDKNSTYRTEHHVIDAPLVRVFQYERDADGRHKIDPVARDVVKRKPFDVLITTPPPRPEDYT